MAHEWDRGVLTASSWHGLEEIGVMADDTAMIAHGERSGAWPLALSFETVHTASGLVAPGRAVVAKYLEHAPRCLAINGSRFNATTPESWRSLVKAAVAAGAKPTGCFSLREGTRILATFEVGHSNGVRTNLVMCDAFDGSMYLTGGFSSTRVVCANTLSVALRSDGDGMAKLRHTASLEEKINRLREGIASAIVSGDKVRDAYYKAEQTKLTKDQAIAVFDRLFPEAPEGSSKTAITRAENERNDGRRAMWDKVNNVGPTLATIWNAATYLVDRNVDGSSRQTRGGDSLDSLLFGSRGERIQQIQETIDIVMNDGTIVAMNVEQATAVGIGANMLGDLLSRPMTPSDPNAN